MKKQQIGFSLIEVIISLFILSLILLGCDAMEIYALQQNINAFFFALAWNQMDSMQERLIAHQKQDDLARQVKNWNFQNQLMLPNGTGYVSGRFPHYQITLFWGEKTNLKMCSDLMKQQKLHCLTSEFNL